MFDHVLIDNQALRVKPWAVVTSFIAQVCALCVAVLIPLIYTYELPVGRLLGRAMLLAPPPPPAPVRAVEVKAETPRPPQRFEAVLRQPNLIPEQVAILDDSLAGASRAALLVQEGRGIEGESSKGFADGVLGITQQLASLESVPPPARIRVGGLVQIARLIHRVPPDYPAEAREEGITGRVVVEAVISVEGRIQDVNVLSGDPLLSESVVEAVRQWRYQPTKLNGRAVEVITRVEIFFKLTEPEEDPKKKGKEKKDKRTRVRR